MSGRSVTSAERKVKALLEVKRRVYRAFIFKIIIMVPQSRTLMKKLSRTK